MTTVRISALIVTLVAVVTAASSLSTAAEEVAEKVSFRSVVHDGKNFVSVRVGDIELQAETFAVVYGDGQRAVVTATEGGKITFDARSGKLTAKELSSGLRDGLFGRNGNRPFGPRP